MQTEIEICDGCEKETDKLVRVGLITGKRGRPPIRFYCDDCLKKYKGKYHELERKVEKARPKSSVVARVQKAKPRQKNVSAPVGRRGRPPKKTLEGFYTPALFLLELGWENLFEPCDRDGFKYRCKGCSAIVKINERKDHQTEHVNALKS